MWLMTSSSWLLIHLLCRQASAWHQETTGSLAHRGRALRALKEVTIGLGCFWEPSEKLLETEGIVSTACGYAGSEFEDRTPSYDSVCGGDGNVEAVRVEFDDKIVAVEDVLDRALECAKPSLNKRQYNPVIFVANEEDLERADAWRQSMRSRQDGLDSSMFKLETARKFFLAENYHQNYWQKWRPRYALLGLVVLVQTFAPPDLLGQQGNAACTILALSLAGQTLLERAIDKKVTALPINTFSK